MASPPPAPASSPIDARSIASGLRLRVLLPLALGIVLAITVGALVMRVAQRHHEVQDTEEAARGLRVMLEERTAHDVLAMQSLTALLMDNARLQAHFRAGNRAALLEATAPFLQSIKARNSISHLYFIQPDRRVLLRVHHPDEHGDVVQRYVMQEVHRTGEAYWGYEQGPYGSYTLRLSTPWRVDGKLIGYVEFGVEFEDLLAGIKRALNADVLVAMDKSLFDRKRWESAQSRKPEPVYWDELPTVVLLSRTTSDIPPVVKTFLSRPEARSGEARFRLEQGNRVQRVIVTPLQNLRSQVVGELVVMKDVTRSAREANETLLTVVAAATVIGSVLMLFLYVLLGRVQQDMALRTARLAEAHQVLAQEQDERQRAERELALQQERNELLEGRSRMVEELAEANRKAEAALRENEQVTVRLREAQSELLATARAAGRAEIATNVLHNVGNVLNSVNVSAGIIGSTVRASRVSRLARATQLMSAHPGSLGEYLTADEKGKKLPAYLCALSDALCTERDEILKEVERLTKSVDHIKDIVATQQSHAASSHVIEPVHPSELAEDALRMQETALVRHGVSVVRDYGPITSVPLDRGRVLQILVNLIGNAKQAMSGSPDGEHVLTVRVGMSAPDRLRFAVTDRGVGISPENLTRIFAHGFSTRKGGHGFGLHSSALAARQLGGTLTAHSEGVGKGATFVLELPVPADGAGSKTAEDLAG